MIILQSFIQNSQFIQIFKKLFSVTVITLIENDNKLFLLERVDKKISFSSYFRIEINQSTWLVLIHLWPSRNTILKKLYALYSMLYVPGPGTLKKCGSTCGIGISSPSFPNENKIADVTSKIYSIS